MDSCEETRKTGGNFVTDSPTACQQEEEADSCGELPVSGGLPATVPGGPIHRRCSELYPPGTASRGIPMVGGLRQGKRDRRLSDPGRLEVPLLRVSLHGDPSNGDRCLQPGVRLSDPRLDAIRSLLESGPCEVGEALPTAAPSSPPLHGAGLPLRSKSSTADVAAKSRQARWDSRRLSLPTPAPLASPPLWPRRASGGGPGGSWLPEEMGEAMGAVSGTPTGEFPTGSPPPRPAPIASCEQATAGAVLRRRRSVSLDQSSRLEAISEENASLAAALKARKAEQLQSTD